MPLTNAEKQRAFRERKEKAGLRKREIYLNDKDFMKVKLFIRKLNNKIE